MTNDAFHTLYKYTYMAHFTQPKRPNSQTERDKSHSPVGPVAGVPGRGQAEVTQVLLLRFHLPRWLWWWSRPDVVSRLVFKYLPGQCTSQQVRNKVQIIMIPLISTYSTSKPRNPGSVPHSEKPLTDLKPHLEDKDNNEMTESVTPFSLREIVAAYPHTKYDLLSWAAYRSLEAGVQLVYQFSKLNIYLKGFTKLHLSHACSRNVIEPDRGKKWRTSAAMRRVNSGHTHNAAIKNLYLSICCMKSWFCADRNRVFSNMHFSVPLSRRQRREDNNDWMVLINILKLSYPLNLTLADKHI